MKWPGWLKRSIAHPVLGLLLRAYVGGVFIYASMDKINCPGSSPKPSQATSWCRFGR